MIANRVVISPRGWPRIVGFLILGLVAWQLIAALLFHWLLTSKPVERANAILVLAGSDAYVERTLVAAAQYKSGVAPKIYLTDDGQRSGWSQSEQRNNPYVELAKRELVSHGVPESAISLAGATVSGTASEAEAMYKIASTSRWNTLLIVTSGYHTKRALWTFERCFESRRATTKIGIVPAFAASGMPSAHSWWLHGDGWRDVAGEYLKGLYHFFRSDCA